MKILGLIFDSKLNWYNQTVTAIEKANKAKQALRIISRYFSPQEMVKLSTALFYSRLYYGAKIWLSSALSANLKKKLDVENMSKRLARTVFFQNASQNVQESNSRNVVKLQRSMWNVQCHYNECS